MGDLAGGGWRNRQGRPDSRYMGSAHSSDYYRILGTVRFENVEEGVTVAADR